MIQRSSETPDHPRCPEDMAGLCRLSLISPFAVSRLGLRVMLESLEPGWVFSEVDRPSHYLEQNTDDDVILLDLSSFRVNMKDVEALLEDRPRAHSTLALVDPSFSFPYLETLLETEIGGVIESNAQGDEVLEAIQALFKGRRYFCRRIRAVKFADCLPPVPPYSEHPLKHLSERQIQVFQWIGCGCSTLDIAHRLNLSPKTIETHRDHLKGKLNMYDSDSLVRSAEEWVEHGNLTA